MSFSDCHVTSPYNINALFNRHVVRIGKRISQRILFSLNLKFPLVVVKETAFLRRPLAFVKFSIT